MYIGIMLEWNGGRTRWHDISGIQPLHTHPTHSTPWGSINYTEICDSKLGSRQNIIWCLQNPDVSTSLIFCSVSGWVHVRAYRSLWMHFMRIEVHFITPEFEIYFYHSNKIDFGAQVAPGSQNPPVNRDLLSIYIFKHSHGGRWLFPTHRVACGRIPEPQNWTATKRISICIAAVRLWRIPCLVRCGWVAGWLAGRGE